MTRQTAQPGGPVADALQVAPAMKVLLVDDSGSMRTVVARMLETIGVEDIAEAENGQDALAVLEQADVLPDVALVDWHMPGMNGYEFVQEARRHPHWRRMAIMLMTTENEHGDIVKALAAGATEYLIKPFTADALVDKLSLLGLNPRSPVPA